MTDMQHGKRIADADAFLQRLDPAASTWCFRTFPDAGEGGGRNYTGSLADHSGVLAADNAAKRGVFLVVNAGGQRGAEIGRCRAVFADLDGSPLDPVLACELPPQVVVESSPGKWHAYWLCEGLPLGKFSSVQRSIAARFRSDPSVIDLPRVMRLPGFVHHKGEPFVSRVALLSDTPPYTVDQVLGAFPPYDAPVRDALLPSSDGVTVEDPGTRHADLVSLTTRLARAGLSLASALEAVRAENDRGRWSRDMPDQELEAAVTSIYAKIERGEITREVDPWAVGFGCSPLPPGATPISQAQTSRFKLTPASELLQTPKPLTWLVRGLLLPGTSSMLVGDPAAGKSLLVIDWAACVSLGRPWCGRPAMRGLVVYLAGEGQHGISRRLKAWSLAHGIDLAGAPIVVSDRGASLNEPASFADVIRAIDLASQTYGQPVLIVADTLHRMLAGDESSAKDTAGYFQAVDQLRVRYSAHVLTVHHSGHGEKERARGSSSLRAAVDTELLLTDTGGIRTLKMTKQKDGPTVAPMTFALQPVELPWLSDDGTPESSVVLNPTAALMPSAPQLSPALRLALESLRACGSEPVPLEAWRTVFYQRHTGDSAEAKRKAFQRARTNLVDLGRVEHDADAYWIPGQAGHVPAMSGRVPGRTGHTPIGVSRLSRCQLTDAEALSEASIVFGGAKNPYGLQRAHDERAL